MLVVDPVVPEGIAAQFGGRNEAPVDGQGFRHGRRQHRAHVAFCVAQLLLQPVVGELQGFAGCGEFAMGARQLLVGRFELRDEAGLALAEQGHVIGLLLNEPGLFVFRRHVEQQHPHGSVVREEMDIRHAAAGQFHGADEEGRFYQRQQAFQEGDLVARGAAGLQAVQTVVFEVPASLDQVLRIVDDQMRQHALRMQQHQQRVGNPRREVEHDGIAD